MKRSLFSILTMGYSVCAAATQPADNPEVLVRRVADHIIQTTTFGFVNNKSGEKFTSLQGVTPSPDVKAESKFNKWQYVNGVLTIGMMQTAAVLKDNRYSDYSRRNFEFIFSNLDYFKKQYDAGVKQVEVSGRCCRSGRWTICGAMSAAKFSWMSMPLTKKPVYMDATCNG